MPGPPTAIRRITPPRFLPVGFSGKKHPLLALKSAAQFHNIGTVWTARSRIATLREDIGCRDHDGLLADQFREGPGRWGVPLVVLIPHGDEAHSVEENRHQGWCSLCRPAVSVKPER